MRVGHNWGCTSQCHIHRLESKCTHACRNMDMHPQARTSACNHTYACARMHTHACARKRMHARALKRKCTCMRKQMRADTCRRTRMHAHARASTHSQAHAHAHTDANADAEADRHKCRRTQTHRHRTTCTGGTPPWPDSVRGGGQASRRVQSLGSAPRAPRRHGPSKSPTDGWAHRVVTPEPCSKAQEDGAPRGRA